MIDVETAALLLDFSARIGEGPRADEQLEGAVAVHNILQKHGVAYLADEVGMGKTYVALGAMALFRHFNPEFRVAVIAPRENIQTKWMKELGNFVRHNVRFPDLRVSAIDRQPARPMVACQNVLEFVREAMIDSRRDFFLRLSSFSLGLGEGSEKRLRDGLRNEVPWLPSDALTLRNKVEFKDNFAKAVCCALPVFDLVIVDEGHNLKHGFGPNVAARNRSLALMFGHPSVIAAPGQFPGYGRRAKRVLFLSATPLDESYRHIWNQLDVFGLAHAFKELRDDLRTEEEKKQVASRFLIRRVTSMRMAGQDRTKNQYRREWRGGGVYRHDEPIRVADDRQRLIVALVQKKVAELLGSEKFNMSFQIGMLASFESFLETARLKRADETEGNFDDTDQTDKREEREGIDVNDVNRLARDYRRTFGTDMPHPKMDALVESLSDSWKTGKKALVFVRRVKSVTELKRRLDDAYDTWLIPTLRDRLPEAVRDRFDAVVRKYRSEKAEIEEARRHRASDFGGPSGPEADLDTDDHGGTDTFFAWFFRGEGPKGIISGANIQGRFIQAGTTYSTFFEDNYVMDLLGARPGQVAAALCRELGLDESGLKEELGRRGIKYLTRAKRHPRADRMRAAQAAALELLRDRSAQYSESARIVWHARIESAQRKPHASETLDLTRSLEYPTFFTELRRPEWVELRRSLWPESKSGQEAERFVERELRGQLLASTARLGHSLIDLYVVAIQRLGSLEQRASGDEDEEGFDLEISRVTDYLQLLEEQRSRPLQERAWGAFDELAAVGQNFELILDVNAPDARNKPLRETARYLGSLLRQQQPIGGMFGQVNRTLVQQFRMPGYPFVLISTDLLQEGEDLHTFCSAVHHYGIAWTPSSMEQRIGRIDRVRSHTDRRLSGSEQEPSGEELLQVFYPHLEDTVEVLQVQRVLERMNTFLRLMHEGLSVPKGDHRTVDVSRELVNGRRRVEAIRERLQTAFPIPEWAKQGTRRTLATNPETASALIDRFNRVRENPLPGLDVEWEGSAVAGQLLGTVRLKSGRIQPFTLLLKSDGQYLVVRCVSPVGQVGPEEGMPAIVESVHRRRARIGAILGQDESSYDLTVEDDVLLGAPEFDQTRIAALLRHVAENADVLEQVHLEGRDEPFSTFASDLRREGGGANV